MRETKSAIDLFGQRVHRPERIQGDRVLQLPVTDDVQAEGGGGAGGEQSQAAIAPDIMKSGFGHQTAGGLQPVLDLDP